MKLTIKNIVPILLVVHTAIWYLAFHFLNVNYTARDYSIFFSFLVKYQGEFYSTLFMFFIALNIVLATRLRLVEKLFSGLDKAYKLHKELAYFIFFLLILHELLIKGHGVQAGFWSLSKEVANPLFYTLLVAIFISALPNIPYLNRILNIPYHLWKYTHYLMGFIFLFGIYHSLGVVTFTFSNKILSTYMYTVYIIGTLAFIYRTLLSRFLKKKYKYTVSEKEILGDISEIKMVPENINNILNCSSGQFAFFEFQDYGISERHPFTISGFKENGEIRISVKELGDWTKKLKDTLKSGTEVLVEGPYGNFISKVKDDKTEIWIAGGIGITPFLAFLENYKVKNNLNKKIFLVWSLKSEEEAIYKDEIQKNLPENIKFILWKTSKLGRCGIKDIKNYILDPKKTAIYICGPEAFRESMITGGKELGVKEFYFDNFNFR